MSLKEELRDYETKELEDEVERRRTLPPKPSLISAEDRDWSSLVQIVLEHIERLESDGYIDDDEEHYIFEAALEAMYGKEIWKWHNNQF